MLYLIVLLFILLLCLVFNSWHSGLPAVHPFFSIRCDYIMDHSTEVVQCWKCYLLKLLILNQNTTIKTAIKFSTNKID